MSASEMIAARLDVTTTPPHRPRRLDAGGDVIARPAHVVGIVVGADVRDVGDAVAAGEDLVEAARVVEVGGVQRQPPRGVRVHRREEPDPRVVVRIANAGPNPVAALEQPLHDVTADETGGARDRHHAAARNRCHAWSLAPAVRGGPLGQPFDVIRSGSTRTATRRSTAITRSYSAQSSCVPPAAMKTSRNSCGRSSPPMPGRGVVGPEQPHGALDGHPFPPGAEHDRRPSVASQQAELDRVAASDEPDDGTAGDRVVEHAGVDQRGVDGPVGPRRRQHGEAVVGGDEAANEIEVRRWHGPRCTRPVRERCRP